MLVKNTKWNMRVIYSITKFRFIEFYRIFNLTAFALRFFAPLMTLGISWILYNEMFMETSPDFDENSKVSYPVFIIIGNSIFAFVYSTLFVLGRVYFHEQSKGTIDVFIMTPVSRTSFMLGVLCFSMLNSLIDLVIIFSFGSLLFHISLAVYHPGILIVSLIFTILAMFGIGLLVNWITSTMRDRTNTANILTSAFFIFCGVIIPTQMLPSWGRIISSVLPLTYGINLVRLSTIQVIDYSEVYSEIFSLVLICIVLIGIGIKLLKKFENQLKNNGRLSLF